MHDGERRRLEPEALHDYPSGRNAPVEATAAALAKVDTARHILLVEGVSDQIAIETLAGRLERELEDEAVVVFPMGGAHAIASCLARFGPNGADLRLTGLTDASEERHVRRAITEAGIGTPHGRADLERHGFFTCERDLEEELIRAAGPDLVEAVLGRQGDIASFRTLQKQATWRNRPFAEQAHRWFRAGSRRSLRYAHLLVVAMPLEWVPRPLRAVLDATGDTAD